jgi:hypothetical protein
VSIWVGIAATACYIGFQAGLSGPQWWPLTWPALFLSLGYNFWDYGLNPPGVNAPDIVWGWIICGMLFFLMGGLPLLAFLWTPAGRQSLIWDDAPATPPRGIATIGTATRSAVEKVKPAARSVRDRTRSKPQYSGAVKAPAGSSRGAPADDVADDLERVATLYRNGELTVDEYQSAKRRIIEGDGA